MTRSRLDVLFVITDRQSTIFLAPITRELARRGLRVGLVCNLGTGPPDESMNVHWWRSVRLRRTPSPMVDAFHLVRLWSIMLATRPRLVHASTPKAGLLGVLAGRLSARPHVVFQMRGLRSEGGRGLRSRLVGLLETISLRLAHVVVYNSESLRIAAGRTEASFDRHVVIGRGSSIGVDIDRFRPPDDPSSTGVPTIGFVGRLHQDKGIADLLEVHQRVRAEFPGTRLLLVGSEDRSDPRSRLLLGRCRAQEGVELTGEQADPSPLYREMSVLVFPTAREGLPNVPLEAQASGVPVVGYAVTGMVDAVRSGGVLVPMGDVDALTAATIELLRNSTRRTELGMAGRSEMAQHFDQRRVVAAQCDFLESMLARG
jgi:glycosyltransferase involved in cell wall biosynthesis